MNLSFITFIDFKSKISFDTVSPKVQFENNNRLIYSSNATKVLKNYFKFIGRTLKVEQIDYDKTKKAYWYYYHLEMNTFPDYWKTLIIKLIDRISACGVKNVNNTKKCNKQIYPKVKQRLSWSVTVFVTK